MRTGLKNWAEDWAEEELGRRCTQTEIILLFIHFHPRIRTLQSLDFVIICNRINQFAQRKLRNYIFAYNMHSLPTFSLYPDPHSLPSPPILCPAFHVHKASGSSVDLGQLKHFGSDGSVGRKLTVCLQLLSLSCHADSLQNTTDGR